MLRVKRVYDTVSEDDGLRILADRLWPRGVSKERARVDLVCPPKRSPVIVLDWKIRKGVNHGQEITFSGADYQQAPRS
jgi:uncharacterized protein YeaO (DUF488 family)